MLFCSTMHFASGRVRRKTSQFVETLKRSVVQEISSIGHVLDTNSIFNAFLERAWHLNPTSQYFPQQYQEIADAVREAQLDNHLRQRVRYADPDNQLQLLNETLKKLTY